MSTPLTPAQDLTAAEVQMIQETIRFHAASVMGLELEIPQMQDRAAKKLLQDEVRRHRHNVHIYQEMLVRGQTEGGE